MSAATLNRVERESVVSHRDIRQELGASVCAGCPYLQKCPGKQEVAQECPPGVREISAEQVSSALLDESVEAIYQDGRGGFATLLDKERIFQTATLNPQPKPMQPEKAPKIMPLGRDRKLGRLATSGERKRTKQGIFAALSEVVFRLLGGAPSELAKK